MTPRILFLTLTLAACSTPEQRQQEAIMDEVEHVVRLPRGAKTLSDYSRFYADTGARGDVVAVYMLPSVIEKLAAEECSELVNIDTGQMVDVPCIAKEFREVRAGERLWVGGHENLPFQSTPGCEVITLSFNTVRRRFDDLGCVGHRPPEGY